MDDLERTVRDSLAGIDAIGQAIMTYPGTAPLGDAGLTSHAAVSVMLTLEDELDMEFPDELMTPATFESVESLVAACQQILAA